MVKSQTLARRRQKGSVAIEFALIAPVMFIFVIGMMEISTALAVSTFLEGGLRQASRFGVTGGDGGIGREARIQQIMASNSFGLIDPNDIALDTRTYGTFAEIGDESYTDTNNNGTYDAGEPFIDRNNNGRWTPDSGTPGLGDGDDIVVYRVSYQWRFMTGVLRPIIGDHVTFNSGIALRNEPF
jgi:Flp pilus assembly protein TadG